MSSLPPRDRVIQAALNLFYAEGFHAVGTNLICAEAKVNKSTLYHLFPSKIDIVLAALDVYASDITNKFQQIAKSPATAEQKLDRVFETPFRANRELQQQLGDVKGCFVGNIALELAGKEEKVRTYLAQVFQTWAEAIEPIIKELAIDRPVDTQQVSRSTIAYLQGAILLAKVHNDPQFIRDFAKSASALVL